MHKICAIYVNAEHILLFQHGKDGCADEFEVEQTKIRRLIMEKYERSAACRSRRQGGKHSGKKGSTRKGGRRPVHCRPQRFVWKQFSCHCFRHTAHSLQRVETSYALAPCASILPAARSFFYFCSAGNGARPARYAPRIISEPLPRQETCRPVASGLCRCGALFEMLYS